MAERLVTPLERLARAAAGLSGVARGELFNALQAYHEKYYNELVGANPVDLARMQGKVQAIKEITEVIAGANEHVAKIDGRVAAGQVPTKV